MPRRRRMDKRRFALTLDVLNVAVGGPEAWRAYFGEDADEAWAALREGLGHGALASWRDLPDPFDEVDPRDPEGRTAHETLREFWRRAAEEPGEPEADDEEER